MTLWIHSDNVEVVAWGDEPTENYYLNPLLPLALQSSNVSFSSEFSCLAHNFTVLVQPHSIFLATAGSFFQIKQL